MISRCVGSSSTSRMRQASCSVALGETTGPVMRPGSYPQALRHANSDCRSLLSAVADLHGAVQRLDADAPVAVAFLEAQRVARTVFASAVRLRPEAVVDLAVEGRDVELGVELAGQLEAQVAVDAFRVDAHVVRQLRGAQLEVAV